MLVVTPAHIDVESSKVKLLMQRYMVAPGRQSKVTDIDRSVAFYTSVFGMKELGHMGLNTTTVVFLGYPDAADPQTQLFAREGVLELVYPKVTILHQRDSSASGKS